MKLLIQENAFEIIACEMAAILSRGELKWQVHWLMIHDIMQMYRQMDRQARSEQ